MIQFILNIFFFVGQLLLSVIKFNWAVFLFLVCLFLYFWALLGGSCHLQNASLIQAFVHEVNLVLMPLRMELIHLLLIGLAIQIQGNLHNVRKLFHHKGVVNLDPQPQFL